MYLCKVKILPFQIGICFLLESSFIKGSCFENLAIFVGMKKTARVKKVAKINNNQICQSRILAIKDTMGILSGKWKFHILGTLLQGDKLRFMDLLREVDGIGTKMLSKELQDLELNHLVQRTVHNTKPVTVEYQITEFGKTLAPIIDEIAKWGLAYRDYVYQLND